MDSDNFFEFDTSIPPEDVLEGQDDEELGYDALNDETFGSAAVDGDWEEGHEQMASLTEARRITRKQQVYSNSLKQQPNPGLFGNFQNLSLLNYGEQDGPRMDRGSAPINIVGYNGKGHGHPMGSALLGNHDLPGSPSNSIWTPSPDLDKLQPVTQSPSNGVNRSLGHPPGLPNLSTLPNMGSQVIKTVEEIEEEMKLQQNRPHPSGGHVTMLRAEDFEREMARHRQMPGQNMAGPMHPSHHINMQQQQRPGNFPPGVTNSHNQINRQQQHQQQFQQRSFPNQGNFPTPAHQYYYQQQQQHQQQQQQQQQHQQYQQHHHMNNNTRGKITGNHLQHHLQHHNQGHDNFGGYHQHHHQNSQNQFNRVSDGRFNNSSMYDQQVRNGNHYDRRNNFERRPYDQNRGHDQGKNNYDRQQNNHRDDYNHHTGRTRRDSEAEWEEWHRMREEDEYSGLMTPREKGWLKNIQAMQLNSENPYQDDYYFVMYSVKQQRKREEEVISIDGLQLLLPDRGKDGGREYEPPRLENSLGKLQVVSVNAPRKIIDLEVVHLDPSHPTTPLQREMRKHRHLLLHIEKLYNILMELDDLQRKIRHLPDCPTRDLYRSKSVQQAAELWNSIVKAPERLLQLLSIRKGKSFLYRLMMWLGEGAHRKLIFTVLQNMPTLSKRDGHDQYLALYWPITDRLIASCSHETLLEFASTLLVQGGTNQKANLISALFNKFGISLIMALMMRGEQLAGDVQNISVWQQFLSAIVNGLGSIPDSSSKSSSFGDNKQSSNNELPQALPSVALAASPFRPAVHLSRCTGVDPQLVKLSQDRMMKLEAASRTKPNIQSPAKC